MASLTHPRAATQRKPVVVYHTTTLARLRSVLAFGILPELSRGARKESWLHTPGRLDWAMAHVAQRHGSVRVVSLRLCVPRAWLTRRHRGVWTTPRAVPPSCVQAVNVVGLVGRAAA